MDNTPKRRGRPPKNARPGLKDPNRVPFASNRNKLEVRYKDSDFHKKWYGHWFNVDGDRIDRAQAAGYQFVSREEVHGFGDGPLMEGNTDLGDKVSRVVGRADGNQPIRAILMKLPMDYREEDMALKEERNRLVDEAINAGRAGGANIREGVNYGNVSQTILREP